MVATAWIEITYKIGANNDPLGKEGLTHFMEHCLLKAKVGSKNLIDFCSDYGASINARTSNENLVIDITILEEDIEVFINTLNRDFIERIETINLDENYLNRERRTIIQEIETKGRRSKVLGSKETLYRIKQKDILGQIQRLKEVELTINLCNVSKTYEKGIKNCIENFVNKRKEEQKINLKISKNYGGERRPIICEETERFKIVKIDVEGRKKLLLSLYVDYCRRRKLKALAQFLNDYFETKEILAKTYIELGCLSIFLEGTEEEIQSNLEKIYCISEYDIKQIFKEEHLVTLNQLEEIQYQMIHHENYNAINNWKEMNELYIGVFRGLVKPTIVTNVLGTINTDFIPIFSEQYLLEKESYVLKGITPADGETVAIWKAPDYFSRKKYIAHIVWSILAGTTGELYKRWVLQNNWCYSFTFYPRELADSGYMTLYVNDKRDTNRKKYLESFKEIIEEISNSLEEASIERARKKLLREKNEAKNNASEWINIGTRALYNQSLEEDYREVIKDIKVDEVKDFLKEYLLRGPEYIF